MVRRVLKNGTKKIKDSVSMSRRFTKSEDGNFTIFVLMGFLVIFATTGIGVDIMNFERDRANLQSTLDRAVLAAADLDQKLPPRDVVEAYLDKAGLSDKLDTITVQERLGSRIVSATAVVVVDTHFMSFAGVPELTANAASTAEESIGFIEISMVLDMSGSMSRASATPGVSKIATLREAAKEFVTDMLDKTEEDTISISIIPYATQVNAGANILDKFDNVSSEHNYSHCVNFTSSQFNSAALSPSTVLQRTGHFDVFTNSENPISAPVCPVRSGSEITALTDDIDDLHDQIDALTPNGNTSIDIGMKWGSAMLDPQFRTITSELATEGIVPNKFNDRPLSYEEDVLKVVIVMTDGQNTSQYRLESEYRDGMSNVWFNPDFVRNNGKQGEYSVRVSTNPDRFFWTQQNQYANHAYGDNEPGEATRLTYPQLYNRASVYWNAVNNYYFESNYVQNWYRDVYRSTGSGTKNSRTSNICGAAKDKGMIVYGIAFEAPQSGLNTIVDCASSISHVYDVDGDELEDAFESIASSIKKLRLTQ
ncbi:von Willebrand factor type A domain protein [Ruegeria meonggei]|uniref:von Willebrand factor type A domain protein n=2 Tax=Ruegeria meonggei TaxID=1446476 RepID=A0A1X6YWF5_9RHOB|nr:von Willebrand factor type A domain protein [Ruegeria meonggei]